MSRKRRVRALSMEGVMRPRQWGWVVVIDSEVLDGHLRGDWRDECQKEELEPKGKSQTKYALRTSS